MKLILHPAWFPMLSWGWPSGSQTQVLCGTLWCMDESGNTLGILTELCTTVNGCIQCRPRLHLLTAELAREVWYKGKNAFRMWMCLGCLWNFFLLSARDYLCWLLSPLSLYCRRILISSIWKDLGSWSIMISLSLHYLLALFFLFLYSGVICCCFEFPEANTNQRHN